ncbi:MAG: sel1 repeat family protein [Planctomycetota bacterium]|jgi:TPR repeat protein|nr:sel1 repeat family protein [Planctomycetota bacterium]
MTKTTGRIFPMFILAFICPLWPGPAGEARPSIDRSPPPAGADSPVPAAQPPRNLSPGEAFALMAGEAEKGIPSAMLTLGTMYERGIGTARNYMKALEWYGKAANAGLAEGYYNLGVCYEIGMGTSGDAEKAFLNFEKSAELNLPQGLYKLASLYFLGFGTGKNEGWGVELLKRAAQAGHMIAANDLGVIFFAGDFGQAKNADQAFEMFSRAAQLGNAEAMKNLAVFYRDGLGGRSADPVQELKWYLLARRAGFPAGALDKPIEEIRAKVGPEKARAVDAEVESWIADFQARQPRPPAPPGG